MPDQNSIYNFMKSNNLTDLDEKTFINKYSAPDKAKEIYSFMASNKLTDLDESKFYDKYLKKKVGGAESSLTGLQSKGFSPEQINLLETGAKPPKPSGKAGEIIVPTNITPDQKAYERELKRQDAAINTLKNTYKQKGLNFNEKSKRGQEQIQQLLDKEISNDLTLVTGKDQKPYLVRGEGFLESAGRGILRSITEPIESTKINFTNNANELADLLDEKIKEEPNVPESAPTRFGGYLGELAGGLPKMMALLAIPVAGESAMVGEMYHNALANQRRALYERGLQEGMDRTMAAQNAMKNAPITAIPDAIVGAAMARGVGGKAAGAEIIPNAAKESFLKATGNGLKGVAKVSGIGGAAEFGRSKTEQKLGYNVTDAEAIENGLRGMGEYAIMDAAFKLAHAGPKYLSSAAKNLLSTVPKEVLEVAAEKYPDGKQTLEDVAKFSETKAKVQDFVPEEKVGAVTGLTEKVQNLENNIKELEEKKKTSSQALHPFMDGWIKEYQDEIDFYKKQVDKVVKSKDPTGVSEEIDDITGLKAGQEPTIVEEKVEDITQFPETLKAKKPITTEEVKPTEVDLTTAEKMNASQNRYGILKDGADAGFIVTTNPENNVVKIKGVTVNEELRGKNIAGNAYIKLGESLAKDGVSLESDSFDKMEPSATRVWEKLVDKGLAIKGENSYQFKPTEDIYFNQLHRTEKFDDNASVSTYLGHNKNEKNIFYTLPNKGIISYDEVIPNTNRFTITANAKNDTPADIKNAFKRIEKYLPANHELLENKSISVDGLRIWDNFIKTGKYIKTGETNEVELTPIDKANIFKDLKYTTETKWSGAKFEDKNKNEALERVKKYIKDNNLDFKVKLDGNAIKVEVPVLKYNPTEEVKPTEVTETIKTKVDEKVTPKKTYQEALQEKQEAEKKQTRQVAGEKAAASRRIFDKVFKMDVPEDAEQVALRYLADGGKVSKEAIDEAYGSVKRAQLNVKRRELLSEEVKSKDFAGGKETLDEVAHRLWEENGQRISERDIKEALMAEIGNNNTRLEAAEAYLDKYSPEYQLEKEEMRLAEQYKEQYLEEQAKLEEELRKPLDEQIEGEASEEHINNLIKQYEAEIKGEDQQLRSESEGAISAEAGKGEAVKEAPKTEERLAQEYKEVVKKAGKKAKENAKKDFVDRNFDSIVEKLKIQIKCPT